MKHGSLAGPLGRWHFRPRTRPGTGGGTSQPHVIANHAEVPVISSSHLTRTELGTLQELAAHSQIGYSANRDKVHPIPSTPLMLGRRGLPPIPPFRALGAFFLALALDRIASLPRGPWSSFFLLAQLVARSLQTPSRLLTNQVPIGGPVA
jgi:hypothetical protein